ncbi:hypothetical protein BG004_000583 [Podila humilis]|nr:hypothetical protein BG004_000583 [Podila humilis]
MMIEDLHGAADAKLPIEGKYQHELHWALRWIRIAVETWLGLYCQKPEPLKCKQKESFYRSDVFGIINSLLRDVQDLVVVHGELTSDDTAARRNDDRTLPINGVLCRKKMGPRCDGLVQIQGPSLTTLFANCPGGYVVRFSPHSRQFKLADDISQFKLNLRILKHLLVTKQLFQTTKEIIHEIPSNWDVDGDGSSDDDGDDCSNEAREADEDFWPGQPATPMRKAQLPKLQTSPGRGTRRSNRNLL